MSLFLKPAFAFGIAACLALSGQTASHPRMRLTEKQIINHQNELKKMPEYRSSLATPKTGALLSGATRVNVITNTGMPFNPSSWYQGNYPTCWVWGSTMACSISASNTFSNKATLKTDLMMGLSTGDTTAFLSEMQQRHYFDDYNYNGEISPAHRYSFTTITSQQIPHDYSAIASIKSLLNQNKAVVFTYNFAKGHENDLDNFWNYNPESAVWQGIINQGDTYAQEGHVMCIIGYDDTDSSWLVQNSWGAPTNRPNGILKIPQDLDYGTWLYYNSSNLGHLLGGLYKYEFLVLSPGWVTSDTSAPTYSNISRWGGHISVTPGRDANNRAFYTFTVKASDNYGISKIYIETAGNYLGEFSTIVNGGNSTMVMYNAYFSGNGAPVTLPISVYSYDYFGNKSEIVTDYLTFTEGEPLY